VSEARLHERIDELERKLGVSEQTVRALGSGEIDALLHQDSSTPLLLQAAQEKLRANEQLFRAVFDGAMDAMLIVDESGRYVDVNPAACVLFGLPREQLLGRNFAEFRETPADHGRAWEQFFQNGQMEGQFRLLRPDGSKRDTDFRATANIFPGLSLFALRDITERQRAESRFRIMIEKSHDGIALVDGTGETIYRSPAMDRILGSPASSAVGTSNFDMVHPDDKQVLRATLGGLITDPSVTANVEFRVVHSDGSTHWVASTARSFLDDPAIGAIVTNFHDITERKVAEAALRESQRVLEDAQAVAHLGSWASVSRPDEIVSWSAECARIFGRERSAAPTVEGFIQLVHPDDRARVIAEGERAVAQGKLCETEHRILRPTGEVRWVYARTKVEATSPWLEATAASRQDGLDQAFRAVGVVQDITDRKRVEDELRATDLRYRRIIDNTSEGVWIYDASSMTTFMNPKMAAMLGWTVEEAIGKPVFAFMDDAAREEARQRVERRKSGISERGDFRLKRRDGSELWVSLHADPLLDQAGNFESSLVLVTDITERRRADEARNRLASIVASSDDAIISRGIDGIIRTWNRGAEKLTLYSAEEAVGKPLAMLYAPEHAAQMDLVRKKVDSGQPLDPFEMIVVRKDESRVDVFLTKSVLRDDAGTVVGASIIARDISERRKSEAALRRSEEQFRQAQKMEAIGSLAGGVAHDFNNLLSVILSYTRMIVDDLKPSDPLAADLEEVHKAGLRATGLTRQLLAFSRQQVLQPVVLDLSQVVSGIEKMLRRLLREDIQFTLLAGSRIGKVLADPGQIEQVIVNLVVNARDAMPTGGNLTIETASVVIEEAYAAEHTGVTAGPYVMMAVTDTGTGMDAATKERIFEPFFTTKDKSKGTGLGLSTVYGIIQQSRGHVWVYTELGKGTTFKIYLPRTDRAAVTQFPPAAPASTLRGTETILLVEDEKQVRTIMRSILRKHGYNVLEAENGGEALLLCEQFGAKIHLLLTDVVMPRMSGRQLAERLVDQRPDMAVMFMSGYTDDTVVHHGVLEAGVDFLQKPIMPEPLLKKVRLVLDGLSRAGLSAD